MAYQYPYGDTQQLNLAWFLDEFKALQEAWEQEKQGITGALDAEIARAEAALSGVIEARDQAAASAADALAYRNAAQSASQAADLSKTNAETARRDASNYAVSAAGSAQNASNSAIAAGNSATLAESAKSTAIQQANAAVQASGAASGYAQSAGQQAANAAASATAADGSATAAAGSATTAGEEADRAEEAADEVADSVTQIATNTSDINSLKESINNTVVLYESPNVFDPSNTDLIIQGYVIGNDGSLVSNPDFIVYKIPVNGIDGNSYYMYGLNSTRDTYLPVSTRFAMYNENDTLIGILVNNTPEPAVITSDNCKYLYAHMRKSVINENMILLNTNGARISSYQGKIPFFSEWKVISNWYKKIWAAYGDSITGLANGNFKGAGWALYPNMNLGFKSYYGRGVGGQTFEFGAHGGSVCFINADGTYNSRNDSYNYDDYTGAIPAGATKCRGAFSSWLRIISMFPESIKNNIDMIFIMGGTNNNNASASAELEWIPNDTTDPEWADSEYYATYGGDYNISTLKGGVASTIMKMQTWMPQAQIIIGTPINGKTNSTGAITPGDTTGLIPIVSAIEEIAQKFGCPLIDVYGTCGINVLNSPTYLTDGVHPATSEGLKALGRAVQTGLSNIYAKIV